SREVTDRTSMNRLRREDDYRVLAIDPTSKGFGFAVLEGPRFLVEWGTKDAGRADSALSLQHLVALLDHYRPEVIIVEDVAASSTRRCQRVRDLIGSVERTGPVRGIALARVSRDQVRQAFGGAGTTKRQIASEVAGRFPELAPKLPPTRKAWMSE